MPTRPVSEVIKDKPFITVTARTPSREAARLMKMHHTSAVAVVDSRHKLVGICTERDLVFAVMAEGLDPDATPVNSVMTEHPRTIAPEKPFAHALHMMYEGRFRHLPVVDAQGRPLGMLSARDALGSDALQFEKELRQREEITVIL